MSSRSDEEREVEIRSQVTIGPNANVEGFVAGGDIVFYFDDQLRSRIDELIQVLQDRARVIERDLSGHYELVHVREFLDEFRRLHEENIEALREGRVLRSHELVNNIHQLSYNLEYSELGRKLNHLSGVDYAMASRAGEEGPLICCYLAGDLKRKSPVYPGDVDSLHYLRRDQLDIAAGYLALVLPSRLSNRDAVLTCRTCGFQLENAAVADDKLRIALDNLSEENDALATRICWCSHCKEYPIWFYYGIHKGWEQFGKLG
jgi:hypothetical protein